MKISNGQKAAKPPKSELFHEKTSGAMLGKIA